MRYLVFMLILVLVTGCGSKGPLFLPEDEAAESQPGTEQPAQTAPSDELPAEAPPSAEFPAVEQATTPEEPEQEPFPEPVEEQEDEDDVNL